MRRASSRLLPLSRRSRGGRNHLRRRRVAAGRVAVDPALPPAPPRDGRGSGRPPRASSTCSPRSGRHIVCRILTTTTTTSMKWSSKSWSVSSPVIQRASISSQSPLGLGGHVESCVFQYLVAAVGCRELAELRVPVPRVVRRQPVPGRDLGARTTVPDRPQGPGRDADARRAPRDRPGRALLPPGRGDLRGEHPAAGQPARLTRGRDTLVCRW